MSVSNKYHWVSLQSGKHCSLCAASSIIGPTASACTVCVCCESDRKSAWFPAECLLSHSVCLSVCACDSQSVYVCVLSLLSTLLPAQNGQIHPDWNKKAAAAASSLQPGFHWTGGTSDPTATSFNPTSAPVSSDHIPETHERVRTHINSSGERQHERPRCH